jgi:hypothetical protein
VSDLSADLDAALARLASRDVEHRVGAVEDLGHIMNQVIDRVVEEFAEPGPSRYLIFERLGRFGSLVVEPLEQLLQRSADADQELRVLTAAALLSLGSRAGVQALLRAVQPGEPLVCLVARVLADAGIVEAAAVIEDSLYQCDLSRTEIIECLAVALRHFADPLPDGVRARLQAVEPAWLGDSLLR